MKIFTDGGSRGNPGESAVGVVVYDNNDNLIWQQGQAIGVGTNNEAEYKAVVLVLTWLKTYLADQQIRGELLHFYLDSKLVVEQLSRRWKIKEERMRELASCCWQLMTELRSEVVFSHIPREENKVADGLVNQALDEKMRPFYNPCQ
jgi:ribonuclease HI